MTHALHLTTWYPYIDDVSGQFVVEQCAALQAAGVNVGLIFSRVEGLRSLTARRLMRGVPGFVRRDEPVPTFGFKSWNVPGTRNLVPIVNTAMLRNRYHAYVNAYGRPDILHAHVALEAGPAARRIGEEAGLEYVLTEHSSEILNGRLAAPRKAKARSVYADARCVIAVSSVLAERIVDICPTAKVRVIGNVVRDFVFRLRQVRPRFEETIRVVTIGGLVPNKRIHHVITVLGRLPGAIRARLEHHIIGDGPERGRLESLSRAGGVATSFYGNLPHRDAMAVLSGADLLIHASAYETFGVVLAEAMALGVPVIATDSGGPRDIVSSRTGVLIPVDDLDALQSATEAVLGDIENWRARGDNISQGALKRFHEATIGLSIADLYQ